MNIKMSIKNSIKDFIRRLWNDIEDFIRHLLGHVIVILVTIGTLKLIITIVSLTFTDKTITIQIIEEASHIGVLIIFILYIALDIYKMIKKP